MLDVRRMRVLREVAAHGTIAAAAAALDLTPSAVSQQVAALERETGVALVDRGPSSMVLTEAGRALVQHTETVLAQLAEAEAELSAIDGLRSGRVRLGSFASATGLAARALRKFRERYPAVQVTVVERETTHSLAQLRRGELDLALVYSYDYSPLDGVPAIEIRDLMRDPALIALPRAHPLAGQTAVSLRELADERWITEGPGSSCQRLIEGACRKAGFVPHLEVAGSSDYGVVQTLVAAGMGVAFVPRLARQDQDGVAFASPRVPVGRTIAVACRVGGRRSPAVATMLDLLVETASDVAGGELR